MTTSYHYESLLNGGTVRHSSKPKQNTSRPLSSRWRDGNTCNDQPWNLHPRERHAVAKEHDSSLLSPQGPPRECLCGPRLPSLTVDTWPVSSAGAGSRACFRGLAFVQRDPGNTWLKATTMVCAASLAQGPAALPTGNSV